MSGEFGTLCRMKSILLYTFSLLLACVVTAADTGTVTSATFYFLVKDYGAQSAGPATYDGTEPYATGEVFRVFYCLYTKTPTSPKTPPFTIDRLGQVTIIDDNVRAWALARIKDTADYIEVGAKTDTIAGPGYPATTIEQDVITYFTASFDSAKLVELVDGGATISKSDLYYVYLVQTDTRVVDLTTSLKEGESYALQPANPGAAPTLVSAWSATYCGSQLATQPQTYSVNCALNTGGAATLALINQVPTAVKKLQIGETLVDATDGENDVADQAAIDAALSPTIDTFVADENGDYKLTASSSNLISYKVETRDSLTTGSWQPIEAWLDAIEAHNSAVDAGSELGPKKELAINPSLYYNWLRIGEGSSIPLPRLKGETTRFYRLSGEAK